VYSKWLLPVLITAPESLDSFDVIFPALQINSGDRLFQKRIQRVLVDEATTLYFQNSLYSALAHRPAWSQLSTLRVHLDNDVPFQALSGTFPPHIRSFVINNLLFKRHSRVSLLLPIIRSGICLSPVVGSLSDFQNLDFVLPPKCKIIIFFDSKTEATNATTYLENHASLPDSMRGHGLVREYHSDMLTTYLAQIFENICCLEIACSRFYALLLAVQR